jgi:hypothetical protein
LSSVILSWASFIRASYCAIFSRRACRLVSVLEDATAMAVEVEVEVEAEVDATGVGVGVGVGRDRVAEGVGAAL